MKIGLLAKDFVEWAGGMDLLRLIAFSFEEARKSRVVELLVLVPTSQCKEPSRDTYAFSRDQVVDFFSGILPESSILFYRDSLDLISLISRHSLTALCPVHPPVDIDFQIPYVGYLYDFQHKHFPDNFTIDEIRRRDAMFSKTLDEAQAIIVHSESVKRDVAVFSSANEDKIFALPFRPELPKAWQTAASEPPRTPALPKEYFVACNQFWRHKGHDIAIQAFGEYCLRNSDETRHLVFTGRTEDRRFIDRSTVDALKQLTINLGLHERVHFLGHVDKLEQLRIVRHSIALVQPTFFEGSPGGGATFDAIALDVPCILSNIAPNREVKRGRVFFFDSGDISSLADAMGKASQKEVEEVATLAVFHDKSDVAQTVLEAIKLAAQKIS